jgi:hypothetical protein
VFELLDAVKRSLLSIVVFSILLALWYFVGQPLMFAEAQITIMSDNIDVFVDGLEGLANFALLVWNALALFANSAQPLYMVTVGWVSKGLVQFMVDYFDGDSNGRNLIEDNPFFSDPDVTWQYVEFGFKSIITPLCAYYQVMLGYTTLVYNVVSFFITDLVALAANAITQSQKIPSTVMGAANLAGGPRRLAASPSAALWGICCTQSGEAFGCCFAAAIRNILLAIFSFDIGLCKTLPTGTLCKCNVLYGGPFDVAQMCDPPRYDCVKSGDIWKETLYKQVMIGKKPEAQFSNIGNNYDKACSKFIRQGNKNKYRKLQEEDDEEEQCANYCWKSGGEEWYFDRCTSTNVHLVGRCDGRNLEGELWAQHLKKYHSMNPRYKNLISDEPVPHIKNDNVDGTSFMNIIDSIEQLPTSNRVKLDCSGNYPDEIMDNKIFPKVEALGDMKNGRHLSSLLHFVNNRDGLTMEQFLDGLNHRYNQYTEGKSVLPTNYHDRRLETEKLHDDFLRRGKEAMEHLKHARKMADSPLGEQLAYPCPNGYQWVESQNLRDCQPVTNYTTQSAFRQVFFYFKTLQFELDILAFVRDFIDCWDSYAEFPEKDPTTIENIIATFASNINNKPTDFRYCFPLYPRIPYAPQISWNWNKYVSLRCSANPVLNNGKSPCLCPQYDQTTEIFNYQQPWASVSRQFVKSRLWNTWIVFQYLITRILSPVLDPLNQIFWYVFNMFLPTDPATRTQILMAFNQQYAEYGQSESTNLFCLLVNLPSPLWFFLFMVYPGIVFFQYYMEVFSKWTFRFLTFFIYRPFHACFIRLTLRRYLREQNEALKLNKKVDMELRINVEEERRELEKVKREMTAFSTEAVKNADLLTRLLDPSEIKTL